MSNNIELGNAQDVANLLSLKPRSLERYRKDKWIEGAHYFKVNPIKILYNLTLIRDWLLNRSNPERHNLQIQLFLKNKDKLLK